MPRGVVGEAGDELPENACPALPVVLISRASGLRCGEVAGTATARHRREGTRGTRAASAERCARGRAPLQTLQSVHPDWSKFRGGASRSEKRSCQVIATGSVPHSNGCAPGHPCPGRIPPPPRPPRRPRGPELWGRRRAGEHGREQSGREQGGRGCGAWPLEPR